MPPGGARGGWCPRSGENSHISSILQVNAEISILIALMGAVLLIAGLVRPCLQRLHIPALVVYILLGFAARSLDSHVAFLPEGTDEVMDFLSELGIIALLFRVGVESKIKKLLNQLGQATLIGLISIVVAGALAFGVAYWVLHLAWFTSLVVGAALVATSIGVPARVWTQAGAIESEPGQLLLDIAEIDDIAGVMLMGLLFALAPAVTEGRAATMVPLLVKTTGRFAVALLAYGGACILFAHYAEQRTRRFLERHEAAAEETLTVVAIGMVIAAVAGLLGFSVAIGAFFAGLVFSRDPESIKSRTAFHAIYNVFTPFFFIGIGLQMRLDTMGSALVPALVLTGVAFLTKFAGVAGPARFLLDGRTSMLLGLSMIPRAEVAMIIAQRALTLEDGAIPRHIFSAIVLTCLATCLIPPLLLSRLLYACADELASRTD